jgi:hypothetical protein
MSNFKMDLAKTVAHMIVAGLVAGQVRTQVENHTDLNPDGIPVQVGSFVAGELAAQKVQPHTDAAVERMAAWFDQKKNNSSETTK